MRAKHASGPGSSPYITPAGHRALERELKQAWDRRSEVSAALAAAAAEGDRSENAEYIYRKKELRGIDRRIRYLQRRIPTLQVVQTVQNRERVYFGAWVTLENESGDLHRYRIVGADEIDADSGCISVDAPLARRLLGKTRDEEVVVEVSGTRTEFVIREIEY